MQMQEVLHPVKFWKPLQLLTIIHKYISDVIYVSFRPQYISKTQSDFFFLSGSEKTIFFTTKPRYEETLEKRFHNKIFLQKCLEEYDNESLTKFNVLNLIKFNTLTSETTFLESFFSFSRNGNKNIYDIIKRKRERIRQVGKLKQIKSYF